MTIRVIKNNNLSVIPPTDTKGVAFSNNFFFKSEQDRTMRSIIQFTILKEILVILIKFHRSGLTGVNSSWSPWRQVLSLEQVPFTVLLRATLRTQSTPESRPRLLRLLRLLLVLLLGLLFLLSFKSLLVLALLCRTSIWSCWRMFVLVLLIPIWINLMELVTDSSWPLGRNI